MSLEESDGGGRSTTIALPAGNRRARWSGFGETAAERLAQEQRLRSERPDRYLLQLWQSAARGVVIDRGR